MTTPRTLSSYGGPYDDALPVEDATTEQSAAFGNRMMDDLAQLTRATCKGWVIFPLSVAAPGTIAAGSVIARSQWGTGSSEKPVVAKTATGSYTITYSASYLDGTGASEAVALVAAKGSVLSTATFGSVQCTASGAVVTVKVQSTADVDSDLGGASIFVEVF